jgi:hypothetical protein
MLDPTTGEIVERRLEDQNGRAEKSYAALPEPARVAIEETIHVRPIGATEGRRTKPGGALRQAKVEISGRRG